MALRSTRRGQQLRRRIVPIALLLFVPNAGVRAQDVRSRHITGFVKDSTGAPASYANLQTSENRRVLADRNGGFQFEANAIQPIGVEIRRIGFQPVKLTLDPGEDTTIAVVLMPIARGLAVMHIVADRVRALELSGFYERMADREKGLGSGQFITPEEIELRNASRVTQLFDNRRGIEARRVGSCGIVTRCWALVGSSGCVPATYLNGVRLMPEDLRAAYANSASSTKANAGTVVMIDDLLYPSSVSGIEIYQRGVQAPPKYQMLNGTCGVVLIWTK